MAQWEFSTDENDPGDKGSWSKDHESEARGVDQWLPETDAPFASIREYDFGFVCSLYPLGTCGLDEKSHIKRVFPTLEEAKKWADHWLQSLRMEWVGDVPREGRPMTADEVVEAEA